MQRTSATTTTRIPVFDLYGDPLREPVPGFLHAERIRVRAKVHDWSIGTHRHADLSQAFLVTAGGGVLQVEGGIEPFRAPWLIWLPAGVVHGFRFDPDTDGHVLTVAAAFLDAGFARDVARDVAGIRDTRVSVGLDADGGGLDARFAAIQAEIARPGLGTRMAVAAELDAILVAIARIGAPGARLAAADDRHAALYRRFRALVEERFRAHEPIPAFAAALGVTPDRLHDVAVRVAGRSPQTLLHDRLVLEAKRALVYTTMTVAEIGFDLGFRDPAYFSRFFTARVGRPPVAFRRAPQTGATPPVG